MTPGVSAVPTDQRASREVANEEDAAEKASAGPSCRLMQQCKPHAYLRRPMVATAVLVVGDA